MSIRSPLARLTSAACFMFLSCGAGHAQDALNPNRFNRLLPPKKERTPPLAKDGIHDAGNAGIRVLQQPREAFTRLEPGTAGNYVDWVKSINQQKIQPRYDLQDPTAEGLVFDLNIVREVKGSMPDVVYPHKQHTQWLDCSNCHPDIFIPQKGANAISMVDILLGEKCGVCHGKVAFPVNECRRCHSKPKDEPDTASAAVSQEVVAK
jgi:c(7)-type cytochrome triheme protein